MRCNRLPKQAAFTTSGKDYQNLKIGIVGQGSLIAYSNQFFLCSSLDVSRNPSFQLQYCGTQLQTNTKEG